MNLYGIGKTVGPVTWGSCVTWGCTRPRRRHYSTHRSTGAVLWHRAAPNSAKATAQHSNRAARLDVATLANGCRPSSKENACAESSPSIADRHSRRAVRARESLTHALSTLHARVKNLGNLCDLPTCSDLRSPPADQLRIGSELQCTFPEISGGHSR
jgi:hypothetical protein